MKTNSKLSAYILRGGTGALLFSCVIVALSSAINLPEQPLKTRAPQDSAAFGANAYQSRTLSFADRVAYQRAIEDVYWRHRIWPNTNAGPKPPLDAVMSQAQLQKKVEDYLRNSQTLEDYWQRPLTADQLQTEMERMASHTKQPDVLRNTGIWTGSEMIVWGGFAGGVGYANTGGRYNLITDSWTATSLRNAPTAPRRPHGSVDRR